MNTTHLSYNPLSTVGFDRLFERLNAMHDAAQTPSSYPPYNIIKSSENEYIIELAVAGFSADELDITFKENVLTIKGTPNTQTDKAYVHKGIASRAFSRVFTLADTVEVTGSSLNSGMLCVFLENIIPETKKARKIVIGSEPPQLIKE
jgi:molecular chaperone IbpA